MQEDLTANLNGGPSRRKVSSSRDALAAAAGRAHAIVFFELLNDTLSL